LYDENIEGLVMGEAKVLVLGLGNSLVGDDGVGIHLMHQLQALGWDDVEFAESAAGGIAMLELVAGYDKLLLLDCIISGEDEPGKVVVLSEEELTAVRHASSIHDLAVGEVWQLGQRMGYRMPYVVAVAITVELKWEIKEELSPAAQNALLAALERCLEILASWGINPSQRE
jgi:hydrogenase maturation protease